MAEATKIYSAAIQKRRSAILPAAIILILLAAFFQTRIDPTAKKIQGADNTKAYAGLNSEFMLLPLLGFREAAAGLLWVRCDEFFHSGDYDAILPLVRLITWLDPHAENVYVTGAWHLSYNFTDSSERSDRRYIPPAQRLLDEGIENNPEIPDIKFEKAWECYDKLKDYVSAEKAFRSAIAGPFGNEKGVEGSDDYPYAAPLKTIHMLAHTLEKEGRIPDALAAWQKAMDRTALDLKQNPKDFATGQMASAENHNYHEAIQRWKDRYTATGHDVVNPTNFPAVLAPPKGSKDQTPRSWDVAFKPIIEVVRPRVLKVSGVFNTADGSRVDVRLEDWEKHDHTSSGTAAFEVDPTETILVDSLSVRKVHFGRELDMSKDLKMYSFSGDYYRIILSYNPRGTSPHLQDRFGWSGEGITDSNPDHVMVLNDPALAGAKFIDGQGGTGPIWNGTDIPWHQYGQAPRTIRITYKVSEAQIEGRKPITDADIVPNQ